MAHRLFNAEVAEKARSGSSCGGTELRWITQVAISSLCAYLPILLRVLSVCSSVPSAFKDNAAMTLGTGVPLLE
jgi:hypothetical protein